MVAIVTGLEATLSRIPISSGYAVAADREDALPPTAIVARIVAIITFLKAFSVGDKVLAQEPIATARLATSIGANIEVVLVAVITGLNAAMRYAIAA